MEETGSSRSPHTLPVEERFAMNREKIVDYVESRTEPWDVIVIGGGATGLGTAVDAASRGYRTILLEKHDFGKGTSSRSTKLVHGGVRYLRQGNIGLVYEALRERGRLFHNAPHLVNPLPFVIPGYRWWEQSWYGLGLKIYDLLAGRDQLPSSRWLSRKRVLSQMPELDGENLHGGVQYYDGQFDDARLATTLAQTLADLGGAPLNYMPVVELIKDHGELQGVVTRDREDGIEHEIRGQAVVNATGVFADRIRRMDTPDEPDLIVPSQGIHIVVDSSFLDDRQALMIPSTSDDRVLFAIPWHDRLLVGTTDTKVQEITSEPTPKEEEIDYLLTHLDNYLTDSPDRGDIQSIFTGLRPLVFPQETHGKVETSQISRGHCLMTSASGLITITGGKWTTYRQMAEETVDRAADVGDLEHRPSFTETLHLHGWTGEPDDEWPWRVYGSDASAVKMAVPINEDEPEKLHPDLPYYTTHVAWAVRKEMARTLEDVLARRTRALFLDAEATKEIAPRVARIMAAERGEDEEWIQSQIDAFHTILGKYAPAGSASTQTASNRGTTPSHE